MKNLEDNNQYTAAILVIGDEILSGRTQDTNTFWLADKMTQHGIRLKEVRVIPDDHDRIVESVNELRAKYAYVFTTGGMGPTHDDITAQCIADAFGVGFSINEDAYKILEEHYSADEFKGPRTKMAYMPEGVELIPNQVSAAPGFQIENVYVMAGVPRIMQAMFLHILPSLKGGAPILSKTVSCTLTENVVANDIEAIQEKYKGVGVGSYPYFRAGILILNLVVSTTDEELLDKAINDIIAIVQKNGEDPFVITTAGEQNPR